ncbi:hypothetical protein EC957_003594 [Mortierella hygrophila]|uniref:Uncharacterized protein n=1 Tax=Mortierella hygrophila TaxID=979708 RepID=A0A9P6F2N4_9FUNG|nr:hypothetical protein EC957_003594 [Mortierella hygrophila]
MSDAWPELDPIPSTTTTKAPEWNLRTESELHVGRLEAKLESIKKRNDRTLNKSARHPRPETQPQIMDEPDAEEIQAGQEEADEGLWLLWNNAQKTALSPSEAGLRPTPTSSQPLLTGSKGGSSSASYGGIQGRGSEAQIRIPREDFDSDSETDSENEEEEDRLEYAKAQAKDVDEYLVKDRNRHCRTTCCIIS